MWMIPFIAGIKDSINPCALVTCALLLLLRSPRERALFLGAVLVFGTMFNLGFAAPFLSSRMFSRAASIGYLALGAVFLVAGVLFFYGWSKGRAFQAKPQEEHGLRCWITRLAVIALGLSMSAASTIWPVDYSIILMSNNALLPGQFLGAASMLAVYGFVQLWPAIALAIAFSLERLTPRLRQVITSAVFLSAGVGAIYIFR